MVHFLILAGDIRRNICAPEKAYRNISKLAWNKNKLIENISSKWYKKSKIVSSFLSPLLNWKIKVLLELLEWHKNKIKIVLRMIRIKKFCSWAFFAAVSVFSAFSKSNNESFVASFTVRNDRWIWGLQRKSFVKTL